MRIGKLLSICTILFVGLVSCRATPPPVTSCLIQVPPEFQPDTTPIDAIAVLCVSAEGEEFENLCDLYDPVLEVYADHKCLSRAVAAGHLKRLKGPIVAKNPAEAVAALMPKPKAPKAPKGD